MGRGDKEIYKKARPFTSETGREAQPKSVAARADNKFSQGLAQKMLNGSNLTEEEKETMRARGIEDPTEWQVAFNACLQEAKQGNYKAFAELLKIAGLYVEKQAVDVGFTEKIKQMTPEQARDYLASLNG